MAKSIAKLKMTKGIKLPTAPSIPKGAQILPHNIRSVSEEGFSFSFSCFDREHDLFNLGSGKGREPIQAKWFLDLLDCLKDVSTYTVQRLKTTTTYDLHPVDWKNTNAKLPENYEQCEFWQFRISKSKGRVIGILYEGVFYIVWLDPHHNLTDSEGYRGATYYPRPKSEYELLCEKCCDQEREILELREILDTATAPSTPNKK